MELAVASVRVRSPSSTANFGSGYDSLGMALDVWNEVAIEKSDTFSFECEGEGKDHCASEPQHRDNNMVILGVETALEAAGFESIPTLAYKCINRVPFARGMGSSSTALVAGLLAGSILSGKDMSQHSLLQHAARIEGEPDNVAPSLYGGFQIGVTLESGDEWISETVDLPENDDEHALSVVLFIPDQPIKTADARAVLSPQVPLGDAIFNLSRTALLVNSLVTRRYERLREATKDRLHQNQRGTLMPYLKEFVADAYEAGAVASFLSGAGSTICALCEKSNAEKVLAAFEGAAKRLDVGGRSLLTKPTKRGAHAVV